MSVATRTPIKAVFFDFMGTCLDWHSAVMKECPPGLPKDKLSLLALEWRKQYFLANSRRLRVGLAPEDIDKTLERTLETVLSLFEEQIDVSAFGTDGQQIKRRMVQAWHAQAAWPEVPAAVQALRDDLGLDVFVHGNGTVRLQLDLTRFAGLTTSFRMLFSSELLGVYKPDPEAYLKALRLLKLQPEEVVMVAAHAYDLRGAKDVGMRTVYVHRWTDDVNEDMDSVRNEFEVFLQDMTSLPAVIKSLS